MKRFVALLAVVLVVASVWRKPAVPPRADPTTAPPTAPVSTRAQSTVGFRTRAQLEEHFQKHGSEFGRISIHQYLDRAQALRDAPVGGDVLEVVRPSDGVVSRFDRASGAFLATDPGGIIRTFFKPNDGEAYFRRQAKRRPSP
ncbi:MAG: hypothetical protein ABMA00_09290 [Gemmatimonas sp.]